VSIALLRAIVILSAALLALIPAPALLAQSSAASQTLFNSANHDRAAAGLRPLKWDSALANAAHQHARKMAQMNQLSHQLPGEPPMQDRAKQAGARFSLIAENIAQGPTAEGIHQQWMHSPPHRANLLDPQLNAIGIAVVQSGNMLFAVEDFAASVAAAPLSEQERQVASELVARHPELHVDAGSRDARKTCELDRGWAGDRPTTVLRYESSDITHIPDDVLQKITPGKYHQAWVGACHATGNSDFARFRVAIMLF
jgi:Cysteine-rich secretory protein family